MAEETAAAWLDGRIDAMREHLAALATAAPTLPAELAQVQERIAQEAAARGSGVLFLLFAGFLGLGLALEIAYRYATPAGLPAQQLKAIGLRFARDTGAVLAFALGSVAVFLAFDWPAHTRGAVLAFLTALIVLRLVTVASRTLLAPGEEHLRILPMESDSARFAHTRIVLFAGWLVFGWVIAVRLAAHGMPLAPRLIIVYLMGLGLLAIAVEALWRRSRLAAVALLGIWILWVLQFRGLFWLAVIAFALPTVLRQVQAGASHVLGAGVPAAATGRALRALAIIGAAWILVAAFSVNLDAVAAGTTMWMRVLRGALHALAIVLIADVVWMVCAALIDQRLAAVQPPGEGDEDQKRARLRTLLPIVRGALAAALIVMVVLMAAAALGIEVAPLLAGAGVVGVAVGFGAQTLVRDLFSKFFYLLDDAFRIGEYIESGNYKGTVEHLGVRSIRLRHHRGPIFTIPYGELGAVKNSSRDWVIDKMTLGVTYDTDLDKAKKLIKKIGQRLAEEPEFAGKILEPLKMQGVEQFGDFAIQIRIKMKTRPNEQFTIRRRAYAMIKKAFAENGIHFAFPTVQVAGGAEPTATAVARQALELNQAPKASSA